METDPQPQQEQLQLHLLLPHNQRLERLDEREHHLHDLLLLHQQHQQQLLLQHQQQQRPEDGEIHLPHHLHPHYQVASQESSSSDMSYLASHPSACSFQDYLDPDSDPDADSHFPSVNLSFGSSSSPSDNDGGSIGRSSAEDGSADENSVHVRAMFSSDSSLIEHFVASSQQHDMG